MIPHTWKDFKLNLPGFMILRIFTGENLVEMSLKIREEAGERQELMITYDSDSFGKFIESLKKINSRIEKKDFGSQVLEYNLFSSDKIRIGLYFNKEDWRRLYQFIESCCRKIQAQELEHKK